VEKHGTAGQATKDNMVHALCKLDIQGHKHTLRKRKTYCNKGYTNAPQCYVTRTVPV